MAHPFRGFVLRRLPRVPKHRIGTLVPIVVVLSALLACDRAGSRPRVSTTDSAGVEIATLETLPSLLDSTYMWRVEVNRELHTQGGGPDAEPVIYNPDGIVPLRDGRILVTDPLADRPLALADMDRGAVVARLGQRGQGPSELSGSLVAWEDGEGFLWAMGRRNRRVHRYSPDGSLQSSRQIERRGLLLRALVRPGTDEVYVELFIPPRRQPTAATIARVDVDSGLVQDRLVDLPNDPAPGPGPTIQPGRSLWTALQSGVVTARSDLPSFRYYSYEGELIREIRLPLSKRELTQADIRRAKDQLGGFARFFVPGPIAITNGLYAVDDSLFGMYQSSIWRAAEDPRLPPGRSVLRLVSVTGEYMGVLWLPREFRLLGSGQGVLWGTVPDVHGVPIIQELTLTRPPALAR